MKNTEVKEIANKFIKAMEDGTAPWQRPWESSPYSPKNGVTGHEYRGLNAVMLAMNEYNDPRYCTFKQANESGYRIKKGSKAQVIRYCCLLKPQNEDENNEEEIIEKPIFIEKHFHVFNYEQMEGVPTLEIKETEKEFNPIPRCEKIIANFDVKIEENHKSDRAFYSVNEDKISVPNRERFVDELSFYHTVFHEMAHATGAAHRLNRNIANRYGSQSYAFEELVAEITSFLVGRTLGCGSEPKKESVDYVASWIQLIKKDNNAILKACALAEKACQFITQKTETN